MFNIYDMISDVGKGLWYSGVEAMMKNYKGCQREKVLMNFQLEMKFPL